ncbi:MAG: DUF2442 domain-containing protein [Clostridiales bacterium]|jgi:hypothetical protein|nr:DUF2442 domain-containing protein [Clostridiales bacterium]
MIRELGPRVIGVEPLENYRLLIIWSNGEKREFDVTRLLSYEPFRPLQNEEVFRSVQVKYGSIFWDDNMDYCPDTLYINSNPVKL